MCFEGIMPLNIYYVPYLFSLQIAPVLGSGLGAGLAPSPEQDQAVASGRAKYTELSAAGAMPR